MMPILNLVLALLIFSITSPVYAEGSRVKAFYPGTNCLWSYSSPHPEYGYDTHASCMSYWHDYNRPNAEAWISQNISSYSWLHVEEESIPWTYGREPRVGVYSTSSPPVSFMGYGGTYTDEQCDALAPGYVSSGETSTTSSPGCLPPPDPKELADQECEAIKPTFITLVNKPTEEFSWDFNGCRFTANSLWLETPSGEYSATVGSAVAIEPDPETIDETIEDATGPGVENSSNDYFETTDVANDCPWSNYGYGGKTYCYVGDDASQGSEYADGSERINHWDGSYDVVASDGTTTSYNNDGSLKDPGTAPTTSGSGTGTGPGSGGGGGWTAGTAEPAAFDKDGKGAQLIQDAKDRLTETIGTIKGEMSGLYSDVSASGTCTDFELSWRGATKHFGICEKLETWGGDVRSAILLACSLLSFGIILRARD